MEKEAQEFTIMNNLHSSLQPRELEAPKFEEASIYFEVHILGLCEKVAVKTDFQLLASVCSSGAVCLWTLILNTATNQVQPACLKA